MRWYNKVWQCIEMRTHFDGSETFIIWGFSALESNMDCCTWQYATQRKDGVTQMGYPMLFYEVYKPYLLNGTGLFEVP